MFSSTPEAKSRRHRNKHRIWRRALKRLNAPEVAPIPTIARA